MRHVRKQQKSLMPKILLIVVLVAALSISSVVTVMANTADITVYDGSETYRFSMIGQNPQDILSRAQTEGMAPVSDIDTYDFSPENGTLTVQRFVRVSVKEDNASQMILAPKGKTLSDVFAENEITLGENDRILVATAEGEKQVKAEDNVSSGDVIRVVRIRTEEVTENEAVAYSTVYEDTEELYEGETETKTEGVEGEAKVTYTVTYADGEEENRVVKTKEVLKEAKSAVVLRGTKEKQNVFTDASGAPSSFEYSLTGSCTAYYAPAGAVTSIGATPQVGYVAVDPNRIPYGSLLYITAVDGSWTYGYCYAMDTGGAAMCGDIVADLYYDTLEDCTAFGRRDMIVYVVRAGW